MNCELLAQKILTSKQKGSGINFWEMLPQMRKKEEEKDTIR